MGRMEDSAREENLLSAARATHGAYTKADVDALCAIAAAGALKGREIQADRDLKDLALMIGRLVTALRKARPMAPQDLDYQALDLLARKGLSPCPLRKPPNEK